MLKSRVPLYRFTILLLLDRIRHTCSSLTKGMFGLIIVRWLGVCCFGVPCADEMLTSEQAMVCRTPQSMMKSSGCTLKMSCSGLLSVACVLAASCGAAAEPPIMGDSISFAALGREDAPQQHEHHTLWKNRELFSKLGSRRLLVRASCCSCELCGFKPK